MPFNIGFTGTQQGMTVVQTAKVAEFFAFAAQGPKALHHGDCIGADAQAHGIARTLGMFIVLHPPLLASKRAGCKADREMPAKPYLVRNHEIVDDSQVLIAAPKEFTEQLRSGTWATIRYARKIGRTVRIMFPDGSIGR